MSYTRAKYSLFSNMSRQDVVRNYQPTLEDALSTNGWKIKTKQSYTNHFWFIEMWVLQSQWSPTNLQLFLVFEDDEMFYSAAIALQEPIEHHSTDWIARLYLKKGWEKELQNFLAEMNAIRDNLTTSQG